MQTRDEAAPTETQALHFTHDVALGAQTGAGAPAREARLDGTGRQGHHRRDATRKQKVEKTMTATPTPAELRRSIIMSVLEERGPCLMDYLFAIIKGRTHQPLVAQQLQRDVRMLQRSGVVRTSKVTGLASGPKIHGQMLTIVHPREKKHEQ